MSLRFWINTPNERNTMEAARTSTMEVALRRILQEMTDGYPG